MGLVQEALECGSGGIRVPWLDFGPAVDKEEGAPSQKGYESEEQRCEKWQAEVDEDEVYAPA